MRIIIVCGKADKKTESGKTITEKWMGKEEGTKHDRWTKGKETEFIPRHAEINEILAKAIIKRRHLK